jgi:hypothetical protein
MNFGNCSQNFDGELPILQSVGVQKTTNENTLNKFKVKSALVDKSSFE